MDKLCIILPLQFLLPETKSPESLGWKMNYVDSLYRFLEGENTKAFIVLKDGKIVLEKYFGTFTADIILIFAPALLK